MAVLSLENTYYRLEDSWPVEGGAAFRVALLPHSEVYQGHFPGRPVCPGVCHIELVRQCAERLTQQRLRIRTVALGRFPAMASPVDCPWVEVTVRVSPSAVGFSVNATLQAGGKTFLEFKGEMSL